MFQCSIIKTFYMSPLVVYYRKEFGVFAWNIGTPP